MWAESLDFINSSHSMVLHNLVPILVMWLPQVKCCMIYLTNLSFHCQIYLILSVSYYEIFQSQFFDQIWFGHVKRVYILTQYERKQKEKSLSVNAFMRIFINIRIQCLWFLLFYAHSCIHLKLTNCRKGNCLNNKAYVKCLKFFLVFATSFICVYVFRLVGERIIFQRNAKSWYLSSSDYKKLGQIAIIKYITCLG